MAEQRYGKTAVMSGRVLVPKLLVDQKGLIMYRYPHCLPHWSSTHSRAADHTATHMTQHCPTIQTRRTSHAGEPSVTKLTLRFPGCSRLPHCLCLFPLLHPVRFSLQLFLTAHPAARLMPTSQSTTLSLLAEYHFVDHLHIPHCHRCQPLYRLLRHSLHARHSPVSTCRLGGAVD